MEDKFRPSEYKKVFITIVENGIILYKVDLIVDPTANIDTNIIMPMAVAIDEIVGDGNQGIKDNEEDKTNKG